MPISIKNKKAESLAREISELTGENITLAITHALEDRLTRLKGRKTTVDLVGEIMTISNRCKAIQDIDDREPDGILGYDQNGVC